MCRRVAFYKEEPMPPIPLRLSLLAFAAACGVNVSQPSEPTGTIVFALDAETCPQETVSIDMFVDGAYESTSTFLPGTERAVEVAVGPHVASAMITGSTEGFEEAGMVVKTNATVSYLMVCQ
jgi:hypothetical protein